MHHRWRQAGAGLVALLLLLASFASAAEIAKVSENAPAPYAYVPTSGEEWVFPSLTSSSPLVWGVEPPPAPEPEPRPEPEDGPLVVGYYSEDYTGDTRSLNSMQQAGESLDRVVNFSLQLGADGSVTTHAYPALAAQAGASGIPVYGLLHNWIGGGFNQEVATAVLTSPERRRRLADELIRVAEEYGLDGIDVDLEYLPASLRENYTTLVRELSERLKPAGLGLSISVPGKVWDDRTSPWGGAFDYAALGQYVDEVAIMAYDEHAPGLQAGPVASLGWVKQVVQYAVSKIEPSKILLGIPAYGYDWIAGTTVVRGLSATGAISRAAERGAEILWDSAAQVPYYIYWDGPTQRIVYFENGASARPKLDLVTEYGLRGIAIWRLGLEEPGLWTAIRDRLE